MSMTTSSTSVEMSMSMTSSMSVDICMNMASEPLVLGSVKELQREECGLLARSPFDIDGGLMYRFDLFYLLRPSNNATTLTVQRWGPCVCISLLVVGNPSCTVYANPYL